MASDFEEMELRALLAICVNHRHPDFEKGWREFDRRFQPWITGKILARTTSRADVEEIFQLVYERLCHHQFKALKDFNAKNSEVAFRAWLGIIAHRAAAAYLTRQRKYDPLENQTVIAETNADVDRQAHESIVRKLHHVLSRTQKNEAIIERDIFIYLLRKIYNLKSKEVASISILEIKANHVDSVVSRLNEELREKYDEVRDL